MEDNNSFSSSFPPMDVSPEQVHYTEQLWARAKEMLETRLAVLIHDAPFVAKQTGLSDESALFDYMLAFLRHTHAVQPTAEQMTMVMCAAAFTILAREPRVINDSLAQYEREVSGDDDN